MSGLATTRKHPVLSERENQLKTNLLALYGGRPYVHARLSRYPAETDIEWRGVTPNGIVVDGLVGRRDRASLVNYCSRIASKINQFVFKQEVDRLGINPEFKQDATAMGQSVDAFWKDVSLIYSACGWCWVSVDAPQIMNPDGTIMSRAEVEASGFRPIWMHYTPLEVVDWSFDEDGGLQYLIVERTKFFNPSPHSKPVLKVIRDVWEPGLRTEYTSTMEAPAHLHTRTTQHTPAQHGASGTVTGIYRRITQGLGLAHPYGEFVKTDEIEAPAEIPFVCVGTPSKKPWWYDDLESGNRSIMDLESSYDESLVKGVFPQRVYPRSIASSDSLKGRESKEQKEIVLGLGNPVLETEQEKGIARIISWNGGDAKIMQERIDKKRRDLFDIVGLSLRIESRQVESAEAKAFNNLDTESVLTDRANILEEAENKLVDITAELSTGFPVYEAKYNKRFDVSNFKENIEAIILVTGMDIPDSARQELNRSAYSALEKQGIVDPTAERAEKIDQDFDSHSSEGLEFNQVTPPPTEPIEEPEEDEE